MCMWYGHVRLGVMRVLATLCGCQRDTGGGRGMCIMGAVGVEDLPYPGLNMTGMTELDVLEGLGMTHL